MIISAQPKAESPPVQDDAPRKFRLAILQRVCTGYRLPLFRRLAADPGTELKLFIGADVPDSKVKNVADITGVAYQKLTTRFPSLGKRVLPWHVGLVAALREFSPVS